MIKRAPTVLWLSRARRRGLLRQKSRDNLFGSKSLRTRLPTSPGFLIVARTLATTTTMPSREQLPATG